MKVRDKIKYTFAGVLALMTVLAIGGLFFARHQRQQISEQEELQLKQTISAFGTNGALPEKIELPDEPVKPVVGTAGAPQTK